MPNEAFATLNDVGEDIRLLASGGAYVFFRVLGAREARKRSRAAAAAAESEDGPGISGGEEP